MTTIASYSEWHVRGNLIEQIAVESDTAALRLRQSQPLVSLMLPALAGIRWTLIARFENFHDPAVRKCLWPALRRESIHIFVCEYGPMHNRGKEAGAKARLHRGPIFETRQNISHLSHRFA